MNILDLLISHIPEIIGLFGAIIMMIRNHQKHKDDLEQLRKDLQAHAAHDEKEFARVESTIESGINRLEQKLDLITTHLLNKK